MHRVKIEGLTDLRGAAALSESSPTRWLHPASAAIGASLQNNQTNKNRIWSESRRAACVLKMRSVETTWRSRRARVLSRCCVCHQHQRAECVCVCVCVCVCPALPAGSSALWIWEKKEVVWPYERLQPHSNVMARQPGACLPGPGEIDSIWHQYLLPRAD